MSGRTVSFLIGVAGGIWSLAGLMMPSGTLFFASLALLGPIVAGAAAAAFAAQRERRELDVDEAIYVGVAAGISGGFVVAVPFPLAVALVTSPTSRAPMFPAAGTIGPIIIAALILIGFVALSVVAAVIASRFASRELSK